jgi:outer membrane lipoprotein-sorting protein
MRRPLRLLALLFFLSSAVQAQSLSLQQLTDRMQKHREGIEDLSARALFSFRLNLGIIPYTDSLKGSYYFKKPDKHKLDFPDAPSYLKSVPSMFSWKLPSAEKYDSKVSGPLTEHGAPIYRLLFSSRNPSSKTSTITVIIDANNWRVARQDTLYRDGGSVLLTFAYRDWQGQNLMEKVSGKVDIPSYSLTGSASITLSEQKVNEGVEDSVFSE